MYRVTHPRHILDRLIDNERSLDSLDIASSLQHAPEYVAGNDARPMPKLRAVEIVGDASQAGGSSRTFHNTIVARVEHDL